MWLFELWSGSGHSVPGLDSTAKNAKNAKNAEVKAEALSHEARSWPVLDSFSHGSDPGRDGTSGGQMTQSPTHDNQREFFACFAFLAVKSILTQGPLDPLHSPKPYKC